MEEYRSGHNGPDSKSGYPQGYEGSNPSSSAKKQSTLTGWIAFLINTNWNGLNKSVDISIMPFYNYGICCIEFTVPGKFFSHKL